MDSLLNLFSNNIAKNDHIFKKTCMVIFKPGWYFTKVYTLNRMRTFLSFTKKSLNVNESTKEK